MTDVLDAVSTARLDVQPVFDRIVAHAQRLSEDTVAFISVRDETELSAPRSWLQPWRRRRPDRWRLRRPSPR